MKSFQPARLRLLMGDRLLSAYELERLLRERGVQITRTSILAHMTEGQGHEPRCGTLAAYAAFFNVPMDYFFSEIT